MDINKIIINKIKNFSILVVTENVKILNRLSERKWKFNHFYIKDSRNFLDFYLNCNVNLDAIIIDLDDFFDRDEFIDFAKISSICPNQKFIFLAKNRKIYSRILKNFKGGSSVLLFKPIRASAIIDNISLLAPKSESSFLELNKNIKIDLTKKRIYEESDEIFLTNLQHKLILLLSQNANKLTTFSMIEETVYNNENPSKIAIQNLLGTLKRKLKLNIKSVHSKGYVLEC